MQVRDLPLSFLLTEMRLVSDRRHGLFYRFFRTSRLEMRGVLRLYLKAVAWWSCFGEAVSGELWFASDFVLVLFCARSQSFSVFAVCRHELGFRSPERSVPFSCFLPLLLRLFARLLVRSCVSSFVCLLAPALWCEALCCGVGNLVRITLLRGRKFQKKCFFASWRTFS